MATYKVLQGIDYGDKRAEAGDIVDDIPTRSVGWLKEQGIIELVEGSTKSTKSATKIAKVEPEPEPWPMEDSGDDL